MNKLKTLNDIGGVIMTVCCGDRCTGHDEMVMREDLRAEAIKWYKQIHQRVKSKIHKSEPEDIIKVGHICSPETRKKISLANTGKKRTEKTKIILRKNRMLQKFNRRETNIERALFTELEARQIQFVKHKAIAEITQPDAFIEPNICVYADGTYWHSRPEVKARDVRIAEILPQQGYLVLRYTEDEIEQNCGGCVDEIEEQLCP